MQEVGILSETPVKGGGCPLTEGVELLQQRSQQILGGAGAGRACRVVPIKTKELNYFTSC